MKNKYAEYQSQKTSEAKELEVADPSSTAEPTESTLRGLTDETNVNCITVSHIAPADSLDEGGVSDPKDRHSADSKKDILSDAAVHPIRRVINLGYYPNLIDFDPGPMPVNIYDRGILDNFR